VGLLSLSGCYYFFRSDRYYFFLSGRHYFFLSGSRKKKDNKKERLPAPVPKLKFSPFP